MTIEYCCPDEGAYCVLGVSEAVDLRAPIREFARGSGIEIGPGHQPQIQNGKGVDVRYIEQATYEEWVEKYRVISRSHKTRAELDTLWRRYIIADAQRLEPIPDGTLDFIFSSHVFEHFVNPIKTFENWRRKLRAGGYVIGIVPDAHNCFDLRQPLSNESDWRLEYEEDSWGYKQRHYEKWCRYTAPWTTAESVQARNYSIHAHFYTPETFTRLLEIAISEFGFTAHHIQAVRNNKDFGWLLRA